MDEEIEFKDTSPTSLADVLPLGQVVSASIHPLWSRMPRLAGPAYTVRYGPRDNLMLHAAIYRARPGTVVVVEGGDTTFALAGGNVCAVAQKRGLRGFVLDGAIRDLAEIRAIQFPVFARGVTPVAGGRNFIGALNTPVRCGGVVVAPGDVVVGDEDGIVVIPSAGLDSTLAAARRKLANDSAQTLPAWEAEHRHRIDKILRDKGFLD
jgi:4-hydroxy-4-methyl-2-oxoglutarate aldolase